MMPRLCNATAGKCRRYLPRYAFIKILALLLNCPMANINYQVFALPLVIKSPLFPVPQCLLSVLDDLEASRQTAPGDCHVIDAAARCRVNLGAERRVSRSQDARGVGCEM